MSAALPAAHVAARSQQRWPRTPAGTSPHLHLCQQELQAACRLPPRVRHRQRCRSAQRRRDIHPAGLLSPLLPQQPWRPRGTPSAQSSLGSVGCVLLPRHRAACPFQDQTPRFSDGRLGPRGASEPLGAALSPQLGRLGHSCKGQGDATAVVPGPAASSPRTSNCRDGTASLTVASAQRALHASTLTFPCHPPVSSRLVAR